MNTRLGERFDSTRAQVPGFQEKLAAKDPVVRSIVQEYCATLGLSPSGLVGNFYAGITAFISETFTIGFIETKFHAICFS